MKLRAVALCFLLAPVSLLRAEAPCTRAKDIPNLYNKERWKDVLQATTYCSERSADLLYYRGMAFARLQRWEEAKAVLTSGEKHYPRDKRFPLELAGIAFKQKRFPAARNDLDRVLHLDPHDRYAINFLATIYFLEGNQEAAIKNWNRIGKPWINQIRIDPQLRIDPALLDRAFTCSPTSVLTLEQYWTTLQRLKQLGIFPTYRLDLVPLHGKQPGTFNLVLSAVERDVWGPNKADAAISLLRGLPYETVYPEAYNLHHSAVNVLSLFRWDDQKRRVFASVSAPVAGNPQFRYRFYVDGRNENWNISQTFHGSGPAVQAFNLEKFELGGGIKSIANSRWNWTADLSISDRRFRNLRAGASSVDPVFTSGVAVQVHAASNFALMRLPEKRFALNSFAQGSFGNFYAPGFSQFGVLQGSLRAHWFPEARGDDYEMKGEVHGGKIFGRVPFDDLFMLGLERDNNLPLRAHIGTHNGQKGNAPLGRDYLLSNWEVNKNVYANAWFKLRLAPFLDTGRSYDSSGGFSSRQWLWDTGASVKLRILGGVALVFTYGKDLRTGNNTFYFTTSSEGGTSFLP